jgi:ABC-2 type transport system ATP-binding protein
MSCLKLCGLTKSYPGFTLGPISCTLSAGRAYGLLGPNGAGKTTLLSSISAQLHHGGEAIWKDTQITIANWRLRESIAYVPEVPNLYDELTVADTLRFGSMMFRTWDEGAARKWQARLKLDGMKRVGTLSKGMRTKLALLVGICHRASLLLLDEPTSGLDPESRNEFQMRLRELVSDSQVCLLVSSHLFEDIEMVADEAMILRNGSIQFSSSANKIAEAQVYTVPVELLAGVRRSDGVLVGATNRGATEVIVLEPERLSSSVRESFEKSSGRPASLREIYFALASSREAAPTL